MIWNKWLTLSRTLYPDVIESCPPPGSGRKSHHNVGGLPKNMKLKLIEPLKLLFKDEVRKLGKILNVPLGSWRHLPGPGLAIWDSGKGMPWIPSAEVYMILYSLWRLVLHSPPT
ncbi:hypothetical protein Leryth_020226 [Lithospermum erythrorhizon]|nr:hypothetical protein Leryth_020226 [Lithospermum erythrorhizon]